MKKNNTPGKRDPSSHRTPEQMKKMDRGYNSTPEQIKKRDERNKNRTILTREGKVHKGDGMDVDHKKMLKDGGGNVRSNLRVVPASKNRAWRSKE